MRRFNRKDPFRFEFALPLDTSFYISRIRGKNFQSSRGKGVIQNISHGGLRLDTNLELPKDNEVEITFEVDIAGHLIEPIGYIVWTNKSHDRFIYGIHFISDDYSEAITRAIKDFQK
ncbi:PilZ domain-containing protein [Salipaludibacillus sp. HK11]|uniref:PilZ domain-containing protein n=1 Tax=Salipaludibacillus sp. HK11 TaxID=3394320 RepID=UPI0039FCDE47